MSDLESKRRQFESQLDEIRASHAMQPVPPQPPSTETDQSELERRMVEWEALLDLQMAEYRRPGGAGQAVASPPPAVSVAAPPTPLHQPAQEQMQRKRPFISTDKNLASWLSDLDHAMLGELGLGRFSLPGGFQLPVRVLDDDQAMRQAIGEFLSAPDKTNPTEIDPDIQASLAGLQGHPLGVFHVPGQATLLNRDHYVREHGLKNIEVEDPATMAHLISEVARERWGWGYLLEYTTLGRQAGSAGLWPSLTAHRLGIELLGVQAGGIGQALRRAWLFLETGWQDWVWQYTMFKAHHPIGAGLIHQPRPGRVMELAIKFLDLFPLYIAPFGVKLRLRNLVDLLKYIFLEESTAVSDTYNQVLFWLGQFCLDHDRKAVEVIGQTLSQVLGRLFFARLESNVGIYAVPYAVLIAGHIRDLDLGATAGADQVLEQVKTNSHANPDARLDMLTKLDARVKYDPRAMSIAAWERFRLEVPEGYFE